MQLDTSDFVTRETALKDHLKNLIYSIIRRPSAVHPPSIRRPSAVNPPSIRRPSAVNPEDKYPAPNRPRLEIHGELIRA